MVNLNGSRLRLFIVILHIILSPAVFDVLQFAGMDVCIVFMSSGSSRTALIDIQQCCAFTHLMSLKMVDHRYRKMSRNLIIVETRTILIFGSYFYLLL